MENKRVIRLQRSFNKIHEAIAEITSELVLEPDNVQAAVEQITMILSPIRKLRLYYGVPYGHEEEEEGETDGEE